MCRLQTQKLVDEFFSEFNGHGNIPLSVRIRTTQEELYGPDVTIEKYGVIQGGYHPASRVFTLAADNLSGSAGGRKTIRHEVLGHFGLNTFSDESKKAFLQEIIGTRNNPEMASLWADVDMYYADSNDIPGEG